MKNYILAYHRGEQFEASGAGDAGRAKWHAWMEKLGDAMINPGTPLTNATMVGSAGETPGALTGYSVVRAGSLDEAIAIAESCPFLEMGTIEVAEMREGM